MSSTESDPTHTETQETTPAVPRISGPEAAGEQSPQALWGRMRQELLGGQIFISDSTLEECGGWIGLEPELPVQFTVVDWKPTGELGHEGAITQIAPNLVEIHSNVLHSPLANLRISLSDHDGHEITDDLYGKVVAHLSASPPAFLVHFTSVPPEAETCLAKLQGAVLN